MRFGWKNSQRKFFQPNRHVQYRCAQCEKKKWLILSVKCTERKKWKNAEISASACASSELCTDLKSVHFSELEKCKKYTVLLYISKLERKEEKRRILGPPIFPPEGGEMGIPRNIACKAISNIFSDSNGRVESESMLLP